MRIAIVNDMMMAREALRRIVVSNSSHEIAWLARDGAEAVERCAQDVPDLVLMDLFMPTVGGIEATRRIMATTPCAVLIVTATSGSHPAEVFQALGAGAIDAVELPSIGAPGSARTLLAKVDTIACLIGQARGPSRLRSATAKPAVPGRERSGRLVAIGASAGGPAALATILAALPSDFPAAILLVQHLSAEFSPLLTRWLRDHSALPVRMAQEGDRPEAGAVLMAATDRHLVFSSARTLDYVAEPSSLSYRPSIDLLFESIARHWRGDVAGVLLTGMGRDGAQGLKTLRDAGAVTIVQDRASSAVFGMPKAAAELGAAQLVLPLDEIAEKLVSTFMHSSGHQYTRQAISDQAIR